jgi:hypothetical protein
MKQQKKFSIHAQPDDVTCGPTSLHAVYKYYGLNLGLQEVIDSIIYLEEGGTIGVNLGVDALSRGFDATIYCYNMRVFDPTWEYLTSDEICMKIEEQLKFKKGKKFTETCQAYINFLRNGGKVMLKDLTKEVLQSYFDKGQPVLVGLSATYLYNSKREYTNYKNESVFDDLRGEPMGHFVVLCGMKDDCVLVADPFKENPISKSNYYEIDVNRLINAIMLGILTYDANLLIIAPKETYEEDYRRQQPQKLEIEYPKR